MPEKTMKSNKSIILLRSLFARITPLAVICCVVLSIFVVPVGAESINYVDLPYKVDVNADDGLVTIRVPFEYFRLKFRNAYTDEVLATTNGKGSVTYNASNEAQYRIDWYIFHRNTPLSIENIPDETKITISATTSVSSTLNNGTVDFYTEHDYFDDDFKSVGHYMSANPYSISDSGVFTWSFYLYKHDGATCMTIGGNMEPVTPSVSGPFTFYLEECTLSFTISAFLLDYYQNEQNTELLKEIEAQLAEQGKTLEEMAGDVGEEIQNVIDNEKQEAESSGNKFVDQILDALPDPSTDVLAALKSLTDATAYTGTDAVLPIPAIVLPGIDGLFPETVIWEGTEFDFGEYLGFIPSSLLTLVQSLFTIAIVLFCVYELKGIISYCLTLRESKGG